MISSDDLTSLLTELVQCPSVNPGSVSSTEPPYGEGRLVDLLAARLKPTGAEITFQEVYPGRSNLLASWKGRDPSRTVILDTHADTVSHLNMICDPFGAEILGGRLYGRGSCDDKGPMAAMILAVEAALKSGTLASNVIFTATCNEENGATGAMRIAETGIRADLCIAAEPTELRIITRHKGVLRARITLCGKACHSSSPSAGKNAIYAAAQVVTKLEQMAANLTSQPPDPELGAPTLAVCTIQGGTAVNVVPDKCSIEVDRRLIPSEDGASVKAALEGCIEEACTDIPWANPHIEWTQYYPSIATEPGDPGVLAMEKAVKAVTGKSEIAAVPFGTNAGFYAQKGIPCVVFGPGSISDAHTNNESIDIEQAVTAAEIIYKLISSPLE